MPEGHDPDPAGRAQRASASVVVAVCVGLGLPVGVPDALGAFTLADARALILSAGAASDSVAHATGTEPAALVGSGATASGIAGQL